jgi:hyperosmotically inducible protein
MKGFSTSVGRCLFTGLLLGGSFVAAGQDPASQATAPDNTKVNVRDRRATEPTADQQKDNQSDRDLTQQIRQSTTKDHSLSSYAHNVKIISQDGMVTLKGPVRSDEEKRAVETKAADVAGANKVKSELEVKPKK